METAQLLVPERNKFTRTWLDMSMLPIQLTAGIREQNVTELAAKDRHVDKREKRVSSD